MAGIYVIDIYTRTSDSGFGKGSRASCDALTSCNEYVKKSAPFLFWTLSSRSAPHHGNDSITVLREVG